MRMSCLNTLSTAVMLALLSAVPVAAQLRVDANKHATLIPKVCQSVVSTSIEGQVDVAALVKEAMCYLKGAGFQIRSAGTLRYEVVPGDSIKADGAEYYAFYDPDSLTMKVASAYANEVDVIRHEYMRHVLTDTDHGLMNLRNWLEDGSPWSPGFAVESGLAVSFPCSFMGSPVFAADHEELKVKLKNNARFRGQVSDIVSADNLGNKVWGGAILGDTRELHRTRFSGSALGCFLGGVEANGS